MSDFFPSSSEASRHAELGEPASGAGLPHETTEQLASIPWRAPASRLTRLLTRGVVLTISITPTAVVVWALAPEDLKYELRKQARWLPWAVRYLKWWLEQEA